MIEARIVCDSVSPQGKRLTTFKLKYPKFIHGEFMTHRVISRNASSSRAVPVAKLIEEVREDALRAGPVFWGAEQKGMQAGEALNDIDRIYINPISPYNEKVTAKGCAEIIWRQAAFAAADWASELVKLGVHKNIANRVLEPFSHINVVATATEWDNFFGLRLHKDAQPEMRALAIAMWRTFNESKPRLLKPGQWHLPFVNHFDFGYEHDEVNIDDSMLIIRTPDEWPIKVSVARCARVSYESFETGKRSTVEEDLKLYDRLLGAQPLHASPAEHQATPDTKFAGQWEHPHHHGNLVGWHQYRKTLPNEAVAPLPEEFKQQKEKTDA